MYILTPTHANGHGHLASDYVSIRICIFVVDFDALSQATIFESKVDISCSNTFFMNIATVPCSSNIWYLQQCTLYNVNNILSIRFCNVYLAKNNKFGFLNTVCVLRKQLSGMLHNFVGLRRQLFDYPRHIICLLTKNNGKTHIFFPAVTPWLQSKSLMVKLRITKNTSTTIYMGSCFNIWWRLWRIGIFFQVQLFHFLILIFRSAWYKNHFCEIINLDKSLRNPNITLITSSNLVIIWTERSSTIAVFLALAYCSE